MIKEARMVCAKGHPWLSFIFKDEPDRTDAWAAFQLGQLAGSFYQSPPFFHGCPVCGEKRLTFEVRERLWD